MPKWLLYWSDHSPLAYHRYHCTSDGIAVELTSSTSCVRPFLSSYFSSLSIFNCSFTVLFFFNHKRSLRYKKKHFSWFSGASCCLSHFLKMLLHSMTIFCVAVPLSSQTIMVTTIFIGIKTRVTWLDNQLDLILMRIVIGCILMTPTYGELPDMRVLHRRRQVNSRWCCIY